MYMTSLLKDVPKPNIFKVSDIHDEHDKRIKKIEVTVDKTYCVLLLRFTWDSIMFFNKACNNIDR